MRPDGQVPSGLSDAGPFGNNCSKLREDFDLVRHGLDIDLLSSDETQANTSNLFNPSACLLYFIIH
jgi:hypothetical protein